MRRLPLIPLVLALAALAVWSVAAPAPADANGCTLRFTQGTSGTAEDPILIPDRAALTTLATSASCYATEYVFKQTADIDLAGAAWTPIAAGASFTGVYDGGGRRVTGLEVSVSGTNNGAGLFDQVVNGTIRDLVIVAPRVAASGQYGAAGALAAVARLATVERVQVEGGSVQGAWWTGGLLGQLCFASLSRGTSTATVTGEFAVGGLVGLASSTCPTSAGGVGVNSPPPATSTIADSHATGAVTGAATVGGLAGQISAATVERSFATGSATASEGGAGGLVGRAFDATVLVDVYATGAVSAAQGGAGGLVGLTESDLVITRSYATGRVTGSPEAGGLVGGDLVGCAGVGVTICSADVHVTQTAAATSFWDSATTGQSASHGGYGTAKSTAEMQALATYAAAGWPIARGFSSTAGTTWGICPSANGGYPFLQNRYAAATQPCAGTPGKPRKVRMTAGDGTVTVAWEAPAADGGAPVASYTATAQMQKATGKAAPSCTVTAADTSCTITGLRNGRAYRVTLTAANVEGAGTPTARTVTPSRGLVVLSTRRSGLGVVTRVRVREAGRLTQAGTVAGLGARACRATSAVRKAGVVELRCALTPAALAALAERALDVRVVTRFTPTAGERRSAVRRVVFARTDAAGAVTG